jgi:hypothetical protein
MEESLKESAKEVCDAYNSLKVAQLVHIFSGQGEDILTLEDKLANAIDKLDLTLKEVV